jgi:putative oxidoreductase
MNALTDSVGAVARQPLVDRIVHGYCMARRVLEGLAPVLDLAIRLHLAKVFFWSGLTKIRDWDSTLLLFREEYHVPVLPPALAALAGTFGELFFPVLLALGLGGRFAAASLFVVNAVAVISYPELGEAGRNQHFYWGALLLVILLHGPGKLSVDRWIAQRLGME